MLCLCPAQLSFEWALLGHQADGPISAYVGYVAATTGLRWVRQHALRLPRISHFSSPCFCVRFGSECLHLPPFDAVKGTIFLGGSIRWPSQLVNSKPAQNKRRRRLKWSALSACLAFRDANNPLTHTADLRLTPPHPPLLSLSHTTGESAVGKSSLVLRFVKGQFHEYQESTIGGTFAGGSRGLPTFGWGLTVHKPSAPPLPSPFSNSRPSAAFLTQTVVLDDVTVKFEIWDTAGQERYHSLAPMYYRGAQAAIVVYDVTNSDTFSRAKNWVKELQRQASPNIVIALAGNKADLASKRAVETEVRCRLRRGGTPVWVGKKSRRMLSLRLQSSTGGAGIRGGERALVHGDVGKDGHERQ